MITAYSHRDRAQGRALMSTVNDSLSHGAPAALSELLTLGRTLKKRAADVLTFFDLPGTSNGPTEAINERLEHLRGSALGFRNLTNYIAHSLLGAGSFRPALHPQLRRAHLERVASDVTRDAFPTLPRELRKSSLNCGDAGAGRGPPPRWP